MSLPCHKDIHALEIVQRGASRLALNQHKGEMMYSGRGDFDTKLTGVLLGFSASKGPQLEREQGGSTRGWRPGGERSEPNEEFTFHVHSPSILLGPHPIPR